MLQVERHYHKGNDTIVALCKTSKELYNKIDLLMVHCEAGMSRSPAVGAAISKLRWDDDQVFFDKYTPNMRVYRHIMNLGMERKTSDSVFDEDNSLPRSKEVVDGSGVVE